jgi:hypothetical protein
MNAKKTFPSAPLSSSLPSFQMSYFFSAIHNTISQALNVHTHNSLPAKIPENILPQTKNY